MRSNAWGAGSEERGEGGKALGALTTAVGVLRGCMKARNETMNFYNVGKKKKIYEAETHEMK